MLCMPVDYACNNKTDFSDTLYDSFISSVFEIMRVIIPVAGGSEGFGRTPLKTNKHYLTRNSDWSLSI